MQPDLPVGAGEHDDIECEVEPHDADGQANRFREPTQEEDAEQQDQTESNRDSWPTSERPNGFSVIWAAASEAEMVIVTTKAVSTKLISTRTRILPCHHERSRSSIEIDPSPWGLSAATRRYMDRAEEGHEHQDQGRHRGEGRGGERGDARLVAEGREVIDAGQAHHLPPGVLVGSLLRRVRTLQIFGLSVEEPPADPTVWRDRLLWSHPDGCTCFD